MKILLLKMLIPFYFTFSLDIVYNKTLNNIKLSKLSLIYEKNINKILKYAHKKTLAKKTIEFNS